MSFEQAPDTGFEADGCDAIYLRAMLRGAKDVNFLSGWSGPYVTGTYYMQSETAGSTEERDIEYVIGYCEMLAKAGVEPLYVKHDYPDVQ